MPKKEGIEKWKKERKIENLQKFKHRFYIFCEGERTEPNYFKGFKKIIENNPIYKNMVLVNIEPCGAETMRVIGQAETYMNEKNIKQGEVWCVYDKDCFPKERFNGVSQKALSLNRKNPNLQYKVAWSNECIEYWFLLHFAYYDSNNYRTEYKKFLNEKFKDLKIGKYEKNMSDIFDILLNYGNPKQAIKYAKKRIDESKGVPESEMAPATRVYELIEELAKYLPENIRKAFI